MKSKKIVDEFLTIFWLFIIGSVLGYVYETIIVLLQKGFFESRQGLIYGPFTAVYGIGAVVYYLILSNIPTERKTTIFFITMILGGITEYICSFVQEKVFGTISWDYSYLKFNINGRTSLLHCTYWGIAGIFYSMYIVPLLENLKRYTNQKGFQAVSIMLLAFMIFDITISWMAAYRQTERKNGILAENAVEIFLDEHYPDAYLDKIFANKKDTSV